MFEQRAGPRDGPDLSRRDFLTTRLLAGVAGLLGDGAAAAPAATTAEAARSEPASSLSLRDLTRMSREDVRAALARISAQRGER